VDFSKDDSLSQKDYQIVDEKSSIYYNHKIQQDSLNFTE